MYPRNDAFGNLHRVAVVIPRGADEERWIDFAGRKLAERFGAARGGEGIAGVEIDGVTGIMPVVVVYALTPELTELDLTILYGIGLQVFEGLERDGVAVLIDDDVFVF